MSALGRGHAARRLAPLLLAVGGLLALAPAAGATAAPAEPTAAFSPTDCPVALPADVAVGARCGYVTAPLEHDEPDGDAIELAVATFPATEPDGSPPVLMLAGGPGEPLVVPVLQGLAIGGGLNPALHLERDLVLVDQRGVGASRPALDCPEVFEALTSGTEVAPAYGACHGRLEAAGVALSAFDTENAADDVDAVRAALGYEEVHLFGTSYGARLALQVADEHEDGLASLVLSSPVPAEANFVADAGRSFDRALRAVDEACAADAACHAFLPDLLGTLESTLGQLLESPAEETVTDPVTGEEVVAAVTAPALASALFSLFYLPNGPSLVPAVVATASAGDLRTLARGVPTPSAAPIAYGLQASFLCAEEAVETPPSQAPAPETLAATLLVASSPMLGPGLEAVCDVWEVEPASPDTFEPVSSDVPALVVTGQFDQITPPSYGEAVAAALPNATYVEIPGVGHSPLLNVGVCGAAVLLAFVADPLGDLDTSCLPAGPTFVPPGSPAGPPVAGEQATAVGLLA